MNARSFQWQLLLVVFLSSLVVTRSFAQQKTSEQEYVEWPKNDRLTEDPFEPRPLSPAAEAFVKRLKGVSYQWHPGPKGTVAELQFSKENNDDPFNRRRAITFDEFRKLPHLEDLERIYLEGKTIDDEWLKVITKCKKLKVLSVTSASITSKGIEQLENFPLQYVNISDCKLLDDKTMETVANWRKLRTLYANGVPLTDKGVYAIRGLPELQSLKLGHTEEVMEPTDEETGVESGRRREVILERRAITNKSVEYLSHLKTLRMLNISNTAIDEAGREELREALPKCKVE